MFGAISLATFFTCNTVEGHAPKARALGYAIGIAPAGRQVQRDRDAEFRARGTVAEIRQAVRQIQQQLPDDLQRVRGDQPCAFPAAVREPQRTWTQGRFVLQCYKELAQHHGHMELTRDVMLG